MELNLKNKVVLVTGGSHGIGKAIVMSLAKEECNIAVCARGERYDVDACVEDVCTQTSATAIAIIEDLDYSKVVHARVIEKVVSVFGRLDILVNNVGGGSSWGNQEQWIDTPEDVWERVMYHNYQTAVNLTSLAIPEMEKNDFGRVVTISSIFGKENGGKPWFQAAKSAQISFMKAMASSSYGKTGKITFNTVCPGFISIPGKNISGVFNDQSSVLKYGTSEDVSGIVTFLCSPRAKYINGACITVDGGFTKSF